MHRFSDTNRPSGGEVMQAGIANDAIVRGPAAVRNDLHGAAMSDGCNEDLDAYVQELTACQGRLRGFILASLGNYADTADVLQRTNLVLWKKAKEFRSGADFLPWALTIARYEVLSFVRDSQRDRHVYSADVASMMLDAATLDASEPHERRLALRKCLEKVPGRSRDLLWQRYGADKSIRQIAADSHRSEDAVKSLFLRIRKSLERCVEADLKWKAK